MKVEVNHLADLTQAAQKLAAFAADEKIFIFTGEMGAGKTTFIKEFCSCLGVNDVVSSPTYAIVNEYIGDNGTVYHFDFYRIKNIHEAYDLGYEEYFYSGNVCLIEWPEKVADLLPEHFIKVQISVLDKDQRILQFSKV